MMLSQFKRALVVAAHPDDIELGCFGTLHLLATHAQIHAVVMSPCINDGWGDARVKESEAALAGLPRVTTETLHYDHDELVPSQQTIRAISEIVQRTQPDLVITHTRCDTHQDHRAVFDIVAAACRRQPITLLGFHALSSTPEFPVNVIVDISRVFEEKLAACAKHTTQAHQVYMNPGWLRRWHHQKVATAAGLDLVELFHLYVTFARYST